MNCQSCTHWRLKDARDMAKHGFGLCKQIREHHSARFMSAHHTCDKYAPASQEVIGKRRDYLERKR